MMTIELGASGRRTTQLGFGCSGIMASTNRAASLRVLESAFDAGVRHFDVAPMYGYGEAEGCLGEFLAEHAGDCTVTTKFGIAAPARGGSLLGSARRFAAPIVKALPGLKRRVVRGATRLAGGSGKLPFTAEGARASLERSLFALRTDRVDLFLLHEATAADLHDEALFRFLEDMAREGKIGTFGVASAREAASDLLRNDMRYCPVVQTQWSAQPALEAPDSFHVFYRIFGEVFQPLQRELAADSELCKRWSAVTDMDLSQATTLSELVLKLALTTEPTALFLFSSKGDKQLRGNVAAAENDRLTAAAGRLGALLQTERLPQPLDQHRRVA